MVTLHFFNDCSLQQIAELRGKSSSSVKAHLHRGKALLRKSICKVTSSKDRGCTAEDGVGDAGFQVSESKTWKPD